MIFDQLFVYQDKYELNTRVHEFHYANRNKIIQLYQILIYTQGMSIQYYWYFQYFQTSIEYWYFQYFWNFPQKNCIGIEYFHFQGSNTQYF